MNILSPPKCPKFLEPTKSLAETQKAVFSHLQNAYNTALNADDLPVTFREKMMHEIYSIDSLLRFIEPKLNKAIKRLDNLAFSVYCSNEISDQHRLYHLITIANLECSLNLKVVYMDFRHPLTGDRCNRAVG